MVLEALEKRKDLDFPRAGDQVSWVSGFGSEFLQFFVFVFCLQPLGTPVSLLRRMSVSPSVFSCGQGPRTPFSHSVKTGRGGEEGGDPSEVQSLGERVLFRKEKIEREGEELISVSNRPSYFVSFVVSFISELM